MVGAILNQILISLTVQSAYKTLGLLKLDAWQDVQETYGQRLRIVFDRISSFDSYIQANAVHNAEYNLNFNFIPGVLPSNLDLAN